MTAAPTVARILPRLLLIAAAAIGMLFFAPSPATAEDFCDGTMDLFDECSAATACSVDGVWDPDAAGCIQGSSTDPDTGLPYCNLAGGSLGGDCVELDSINDACDEDYVAMPATYGGGGAGGFYCVPLDEPVEPGEEEDCVPWNPVNCPEPPPPGPGPDDPGDWDADDPYCTTLPNWTQDTLTLWRSGYGYGSSWWGYLTRTFDGCNNLINISPNVICTLQACVDDTINPILGDAETYIETEQIVSPMTNPNPRSVVTIDTWFWDENTSTWDVESWFNSHGSAPVSAVVYVNPNGVLWDVTETEFICEGPGSAWPDDSEVCDYEFERPSPPAGYTITAERSTTTFCSVSTGGGGTSFTLPGDCGSIRMGPASTMQLPVEEMQSINR